ncbi:MAG: sensor histidine kinase [Desulfobacteraceae bacterium]|nr:MAG: sensor histidine kinase [Desulfobacteraceae bacterium]
MTDRGLQATAWSYIYENAPLLFLHIDSRGKVIAVNRFTEERISGDWKKRELNEIILSFSGALDLEKLRGKPDSIHLMHVATKSNLPETFRVMFFPLEDDTLIFGSLDADETAHLRREMIELNNQLSVLTRELQKKNHELEDLNRLKNQFLGMAAHDLRKPVSAILNYAEFLMDEARSLLNKEHFGFLKTIHDSTALMRDVIDDFLDISMIESGCFEIGLSFADIMEPVEKCVDLNRLSAQKKGIALIVISDDKIPALMMDSVKIEQVLNNLISNAIEHSPPDSGVEIRLSIKQECAVVSVADTGPGIAPAERDRLFAPFTKGTARKSPGVKSTGLGLAISKKIVEAHGGRIWIEEDNEKGAVFAFSLPIKHLQKGGWK